MTDVISLFKDVVGDAHVITDKAMLEPYLTDYNGRFENKGLCAVRPANAVQVAEIVKLCRKHHLSIVPQGGNTGLAGGSVPYDDKTIVLSLARMNKIREINTDNFSMTADAGCILKTVQDAARDAGRYLPISIASEGSAMIGGAIATNAGGILTMRYGNMRDQVLGLEVVLPNGEIWNGLRSLRKDNTGYDLKQLFIGSEGTLGIVTAAVLKLLPDPGLRETFFAATDDPDHVIALLGEMKSAFGENLLAFELVQRQGIDFVTAYHPHIADPLQARAEWYVLVEIAGGQKNAGLRDRVEEALAVAMEKNLIVDATIAQNEAQRGMFWQLRESITDAQKFAGGTIKHDISVPVAKIPSFIREALPLAYQLLPGMRPVIFGHVGDGNLHVNFSQGAGADKQEFLSNWDRVSHQIHDIVQKYNGSIAAEHGVGVFRAAELKERKDPVEYKLMKTVKAALDPEGLLNPGKILSV